MSRSYRKPIWTQGYDGDTRQFKKRQANKRVRNSENATDGKAYKKEFESWDIVDWKFEDKKNWKARRK